MNFDITLNILLLSHGIFAGTLLYINCIDDIVNAASKWIFIIIIGFISNQIFEGNLNSTAQFYIIILFTIAIVNLIKSLHIN